ncbi:hypothetical protein F5Y15DRAFT_6383 [Xylariaceae sp. FL0016]|nr:hypothetical protein F5Y15DRAFT_6383 [Xylariaceae sp. FL0016]
MRLNWTMENKPRETSPLVVWYSRLHPRRVDVVGDFGGNELFLVHGDSLLLHCISSSCVDFDVGFQILHAIYAVEKFLQNLKSRGCNFQIVFFDNHQELCIPQGVSDNQKYKYRLSRMIVLQHLRQHVNGEEVGSKVVSSFESYDSVEFTKYLDENSVMYILCHDGYQSSTESSGPMLPSLYMLYYYLHSRLRVGLISTVEFSSSRVFMSMITSAPSLPDMTLDNIAQSGPKPSVDLSQIFGQPESQADGYRMRLTSLILLSILQNDDCPDTCLAAISLAFHIVLLGDTSLGDRPIVVPSSMRFSSAAESANAFMKSFCEEAIALLASQCETSPPLGMPWDLYDFIDGRLFLAVHSHVSEGRPMPKNLIDKVTCLLLGVEKSSGVSILSHPRFPTSIEQEQRQGMGSMATRASVLPFTHEALRDILAPVHLEVDQDQDRESNDKIFLELSHWHNAKKSIDPKQPAKKPGFFAMKRNQRFMADTLKYSASLSGASGKLIEPETIVVSRLKSSPATASMSNASKLTNRSAGGNHSGKTKGSKQSGKQMAQEAAKKVQARKAEVKGDAALVNWRGRSQEFGQDKDLVQRFNKAIKYFQDLTKDHYQVISAEVSLYMCDILYRAWTVYSQPSQNNCSDIAALLLNHAVQASKMPNVTLSISQALRSVSISLKIPPETFENKTALPRALCFLPSIGNDPSPRSISGDRVKFQLRYCGPYLERAFDSQNDSRVSFAPDAWQRKVLDSIDHDDSLFIVAPTSSGKTFISFYAMQKVLENDDDGVLVYVAPTKALVNQVAAEIQARFKKTYQHGGRSVWAIHTRDYRINNPTGCQVLVTVPHVLQIMLLAPSNAAGPNPWSRRVKRIIFDEVHCIGQADDGLIWEQLLLMAPCPIIALSATVGNPQDFFEWLKVSQDKKGFRLKMIQHPFRYSDLRTFMYKPPTGFDFRGLTPSVNFPIPGLDKSTNGRSDQPFHFIHPIAALTNRNGTDLNEISLEPRDVLSLWESMKKHQTRSYRVDESLDLSHFTSAILTKSDALSWASKLKELLEKWMHDNDSPFEDVREELLSNGMKFCSKSSSSPAGSGDIGYEDEDVDERCKVLSLLCDLREKDGLPAILFNYDRVECEVTLQNVLQKLEAAEYQWKTTSKRWASRMEKYEAWKALSKKKVSSKSVNEKLTKSDKMREEANMDFDPQESFDPEAPLPQFSFADNSKLTKSELEEAIKSLDDENIGSHFFAALRRGLAVHHAGMNRRYRQTVEMLFRKGFLTAVIATGTLALGINMPCKTVAFFGDSAFLTPLNYRQGAGRAGRRGFDVLGNVVFLNIRQARVFELMSSRLPELKGHFPLSTSLVLRVMGLLHATNNSQYAKDVTTSLLSQNRVYLGGPEAEMSIRHHLRFSIEYLRRQNLLSATGKPLNFAGLVGHLYFTENAAFAFHSLLKEGYFHKLCAGIDESPSQTLRTLLLVMSHLFNRIPVYQGGRSAIKADAPSLILPRLPESAEHILVKHNTETLQIFRMYAETYIDQHLGCTPDRQLPFTEVTVGGQNSMQCELPGTQPPTKIRSPFAALSLPSDEFESIHDLCSTVRSDVFLEESAVPFIPIWPHDTDTPFNGYIYNFFNSGDYVSLTRDNKIKKGDVWFLLKDFSLVLATVVASLTNFIKPDANLDDADMVDVHNVAETPDEIVASKSAEDVNPSGHHTQPKQGRKKVADSWDDDEDSDGEETSKPAKKPDCMTSDPTTMSDSEWKKNDGGLMNVLRAFTMLRDDFNEKFMKAWA